MSTCNVSKRGLSSEKMLSLHFMHVFIDLTGLSEENAPGFNGTNDVEVLGLCVLCLCEYVCNLARL